MFGVPIRRIQSIGGSLVMETTMFSALAGYLLRVSRSCHVRMDFARVVNSVIREFGMLSIAYVVGWLVYLWQLATGDHYGWT